MNELTKANEQALARRKAVGQAANEAAAIRLFATHLEGLSKNTISRKRADLRLFETFLNELEKDGEPVFTPPVSGLFDDPKNWTGITWGIVTAFRKWQVKQSYAISSVNNRLSTVRVYAEMAAQAGTIPADENARIQTVKGYSRRKARNLNEQREEAGISTRREQRINGNPASQKKAESVRISQEQAELLKQQPDTPQGRRDALLMCLLLDHGLRIGEVSILTKQNFDVKAGTFEFYRPKTDNASRHTMTVNTMTAAKAYLKHAPDDGIIWRKSSKGKHGLSTAMTSATRALTKRVELLGRAVALDGLSPHDCRHYAAKHYATKLPFREFVDMFGWNSAAMPLRYIEYSKTVDVAGASK